jgi:hypothetical protein
MAAKFVIRDIYKCKPGKAKELVRKFKDAEPFLLRLEGIKKVRVMTDYVTTYWTVVSETEVVELNNYFDIMRNMTSMPALAEIMKGYMDLVDGGHREIFFVE